MPFKLLAKLYRSLLVNALLSLNNLIFNKFFPYEYEPNAISQDCASKGHLPTFIWQLTLNVAGPLQRHLPSLFTATSVTNFDGPPAKLISSSPLEIHKTKIVKPKLPVKMIKNSFVFRKNKGYQHSLVE